MHPVLRWIRCENKKFNMKGKTTMKQFTYTIKDEVGIHARPAGNLVKLIKGFASTVTIEKEGKASLVIKASDFKKASEILLRSGAELLTAEDIAKL